MHNKFQLVGTRLSFFINISTKLQVPLPLNKDTYKVMLNIGFPVDKKKEEKNTSIPVYDIKEFYM